MESYIIVLFYSKFSNACKKFTSALESYPDLKESVVLVCVDNKEIREKIIREGRLQVNKVPCLMRIYDDTGYIESFEGERAFEVLKSYPISELEPLTEYLEPTKVDNSKISFPPRSSDQPREFTSIESIESNRTKLPESNVAVSTYVHIPRNPEDPQIQAERDLQDKMLKINTTTPSQNLTSKAMIMQKEREQVDVKNTMAGGRTPI